MRKLIVGALALGAGALLAITAVQAEVKTFWDQASGRWVEFDTSAGALAQVGRGSSIPREYIDYEGPYGPNTIVVNTAERRLYYIYERGKAIRYGVGVGREGFQWSGTNRISRKAEWPGWTPPDQMRRRQPGLPAYMPGGPDNPLGARALYIGGTLYRIHGSNQPSTIGHAVSSGCIRMTNDDVIHLYSMVSVGTKVVVLR